MPVDAIIDGICLEDQVAGRVRLGLPVDEIVSASGIVGGAAAAGLAGEDDDKEDALGFKVGKPVKARGGAKAKKGKGNWASHNKEVDALIGSASRLTSSILKDTGSVSSKAVKATGAWSSSVIKGTGSLTVKGVKVSECKLHVSTVNNAFRAHPAHYPSSLNSLPELTP